MNTPSTPTRPWMDHALRRLEDEIRCASRTDVNLMITGESGVGKSFATHMIHQLSHRKRGPFVAIHAKDVASPEASGSAHAFQAASQGTLLMQEIERMEEPAQEFLFDVIDCTAGRRNNVRLVTASSIQLFERVQAGEFRQDLFYRLNVIHLVIPPLRERPQEIPALFHHYLSIQTGQEPPPLSPAAQQRLVEYPWPGNVRELKVLTTKLSAQELPEVIEPEHLAIEGCMVSGPSSMRHRI